MLLVRLLGSSRFASNAKVKHVYGDTSGYAAEIGGYEITLDTLHDSEMKLFDGLEFINRPALPEFVAKQIGRLQAVMARRAESNADLAVVLDTYAEHLEKYPPDVVATVCWRVIENKKWLPLVSELVAECEQLMLFRRAVWDCFQEKRSPVLANKVASKRIEADPRLHQNWKDLPKSKWLKQHFDWAICECRDMLTLARQNPTIMDASLWEKKISTLEDERGCFIHEPVGQQDRPTVF